MGWNTSSLVYVLVWLYFVLDVIFSHFYILMEEKVNTEKFGQEYVDYMKRVPRYLFVK
jgi:protein-S-isoprenylcysteine O-methyltransferase Ste14